LGLGPTPTPTPNPTPIINLKRHFIKIIIIKIKN